MATNHFAPFVLVAVAPNGSFTTTLATDATVAPSPELRAKPEPRRHEVREGDGYLRRDGSRAPTWEVWAVEDGTEWCVDADIRGLRYARARARAWQDGYRNDE